MRILIADDSALFREGLTRLLTEAGHEVLAVADATALLDAVTADQPDFAIIDVRMPPTMTSDGASAARQIRARPLNRRCPARLSRPQRPARRTHTTRARSPVPRRRRPVQRRRRR